MEIERKKISLALIDQMDNTFKITTQADVQEIVCSIKNLGLINPPLVKKQKKRFIIVSGFRRIAACSHLGFSDILVRIIDPKTTELGNVEIAIAENSLQRPLNLMEQSKCCSMLASYYENDKELAVAASNLGLPGNPDLFNKIKNIFILPDFVKRAVLNNTVALSMAMELGALDKNIGAELTKLFEHLGLSLNKQREVLEYVKEIAIIENISIIEVLFADQLKNTLKNDDLTRNQKAQNIRSYLRGRRFPAITRGEKEYEEIVKSLKMGKGISLIAPKNFESTSYTFSLAFSNVEEIVELKKRLDKISQSVKFKNLFKIYSNQEANKSHGPSDK